MRILRDLMSGTKRFGELKKSIGKVSQKVLTAQLRDMEEKGLLTRKVYAEVPPRVEYTLTETGHSLKPILDALYICEEVCHRLFGEFKKIAVSRALYPILRESYSTSDLFGQGICGSEKYMCAELQISAYCRICDKKGPRKERCS